MLKNFNNNLKENAKVLFKTRKKYKIVSIATAANINNPPIYFASYRESENTITLPIIINNLEYIQDIILFFDYKIDFFLIGTESNYKIINFLEKCGRLIQNSKILYFKPNDLTVDTVKNYFLQNKIINKNILICGLGNIGTKLALTLVEMSNHIYLKSSNVEKMRIIADTLNIVSKSDRIIKTWGVNNISVDYIIGTSAGVPVITKKDIDCLSDAGRIIDVGNGTISQDALEKALGRGIRIRCVNFIEEYRTFIERAILPCDSDSDTDKITVGNNTFIKVGMIGRENDILVNDPADIKKIYGICNGKGDLLYGDQIDEKLKEIKRVMGLENN